MVDKRDLIFGMGGIGVLLFLSVFMVKVSPILIKNYGGANSFLISMG